MKLQELDARRQTEQVAKTLKTRLGDNIAFDRLSEDRTRGMLQKVRGLLKEYKSSVSRHFGERNPDYLRLVMMEQALSSRLSEFNSQMGAMKAASATGAQGSMLNKAMQNAVAGKALDPTQRQAMQAMAGGLDKVMSDPQQATRLQQMLKQASNSEVAETKKKRIVKESELQQAQVVMAAQDMVDQLQGMLEDISAMQFKDLPALTAAIKNDMGVEQATQFQADATAALTTLLSAIQQGKTQMEAAQGVLTGQAPTVPGTTDTGIEPVQSADIDADLSLDANLPGEEEEEEEVVAGSLGRERR